MMKLQLLSSMVLVRQISIFTVVANSLFHPHEYEGRVFINAPAGTVVSLNRAFRNFAYASQGCFFHVTPWDSSRENGHFKWNHTIHTLVTTSTINKPLGNYYVIGLQLVCNHESDPRDPIRVAIGVSDPNIYTPIFTQNVYVYRVPLNARNGTKLGHIHATDKDIVIYNSDVDYQLLNDTKSLMTVDDEGTVVLTRDIETVWPIGSQTHSLLPNDPYQVAIEACDYGSPRKCSAANIEIKTVSLSEPRGVEVVFASLQYQIICWQHPSFGKATSYSITMSTSEHNFPNVSDENVKSDDSRSQQCAVIKRPLSSTVTHYVVVTPKRNEIPGTPCQPVAFSPTEGLTCTGICKNNGKPACMSTPDGNRQFTLNRVPHCVCEPGFYGASCQFAAQCDSMPTDTIFGTFVWPQTEVQSLAFVNCPYGPNDARAKRKCGYDERKGLAEWEEFQQPQEHCKSRAMIGEELDSVRKSLDSRITDETLDKTATDLAAYLPFAYGDPSVGKSVLSVIDKVMAVNVSRLSLTKRQQIGKKFINIVDAYANYVALNSTSGDYRIETEKLSMIVQESNHFLDDENVEDDNLKWNLSPAANVQIPKAIVEDVANGQHKRQRVKVILFKSNVFFPTSHASSDPVIEISLKDSKQLRNLQKSISYKITTAKKQSHLCVYWLSKSNLWSVEGLRTIKNGSEDGEVVCESTHLTGFSILLDVAYGDRIDETDHYNMNVLSWLGCALSMGGLLLTIITYSVFRFLRRDHAGKILLNLCAAMFLMNLFFVMSSLKPYVSYNLTDCTSIGAFLHISTLATMLWMGVEAANMYDMLVNVFANTEKFFMCKRYIFAWGTPFILVVVSALLDLNLYNTEEDIENRYCQLSKANPGVYYGIYIAPICLILLLNSIIFGLLLRVIWQSRTHKLSLSGAQVVQKPPVTAGHNLVQQARGGLTVMALLGVTWILGCFAVGRMRLPFMYLFCVLNSLQGFVIFTVRCLLYDEARLAWQMLLLKGELKKSRGKAVTISSSDSNNSNGKGRLSQQSSSNFNLIGASNSESFDSQQQQPGTKNGGNGVIKRNIVNELVKRSVSLRSNKSEGQGPQEKQVLLVENDRLGNVSKMEQIRPDTEIVKVEKKQAGYSNAAAANGNDSAKRAATSGEQPAPQESPIFHEFYRSQQNTPRVTFTVKC